MILVMGVTSHPGKAVVNGLLWDLPRQMSLISVVDCLPGFSSAIQQEEFAKTSGNIEQLRGRKPSTLNEFITSHYSSN